MTEHLNDHHFALDNSTECTELMAITEASLVGGNRYIASVQTVDPFHTHDMRAAAGINPI